MKAAIAGHALASFATVVVCVALGAVLGWLSWYFWVIGLAGLVLGLACGWSLAVLRAWLGVRGGVTLVATVAIVAGWATLQVFEDGHQRAAFRHAQARVNAASTGLSPAEVQRQLDAGNLEYWAADAEAVLERQVVADVGFGGITGRWLFRAQGGVRLAGSVSSSRGLPIGVPGAIIAHLLELGLAVFIARRIVKRADVSPSTS